MPSTVFITLSLYYYYFLIDYFSEQFQVHSKTEWKVQSSHISPPSPSSLPPVSAPPADGTVDEPAHTRHCHPESIVYIGGGHSMGSEKCRTRSHQFSVTLSIFAALRSLCAPLFIPPQP